MQGSDEGNPGTNQDLAQVFTPLTSLAGPNRAMGLAYGCSDGMRGSENHLERRNGSCRPQDNHCPSTTSLDTTPPNSLQTYSTTGQETQGTQYPQNICP